MTFAPVKTEALFRWKLDATHAGFTDVVNHPVVPVLQNARVLRKVSAYYVSKHNDDPNPTRPTVWLVLFGWVNHEKHLRTLVERHLSSSVVAEFWVSHEDVMLGPAAAGYRRRLRQVVDVALELHASPYLLAHVK